MNRKGGAVEKAHRSGLVEDTSIMVDKEKIRWLYQREVQALHEMKSKVFKRRLGKISAGYAYEWIDPEAISLHRILRREMVNDSL